MNPQKQLSYGITQCLRRALEVEFCPTRLFRNGERDISLRLEATGKRVSIGSGPNAKCEEETLSSDHVVQISFFPFH